MTASRIEWTDRSDWNPIRGCSRVSAGCENCYAERQAHRFSGPGKPFEGLTRLTSRGPQWTGRVELVPERLDLPLRWKKPARIFVCSMSDPFHEDVPDEFLDRMFAVMGVARRHAFQILTKRPERMRSYLSEWGDRGRIQWGAYAGRPRGNGSLVFDRIFARMISLDHLTPATHTVWPLPNVWLGVSVENQAAADERIPELLATPAAVRFVSAEPLLGPVDFARRLKRTTSFHLRADVAGMLRNGGAALDSLSDDAGRRMTRREADRKLRELLDKGVKFIPCGSGCDAFDADRGCPGHRDPSIDWVIVGGESGPRARPCRVEWIRSIVEQCKAAGTACFVNQLGAHVRCSYAEWSTFPLPDRWEGDSRPAHETFKPIPPTHTGRAHLIDRKGGDPSEWPADLCVRELPR